MFAWLLDKILKSFSQLITTNHLNVVSSTCSETSHGEAEVHTLYGTTVSLISVLLSPVISPWFHLGVWQVLSTLSRKETWLKIPAIIPAPTHTKLVCNSLDCNSLLGRRVLTSCKKVSSLTGVGPAKCLSPQHFQNSLAKLRLYPFSHPLFSKLRRIHGKLSAVNTRWWHWHWSLSQAFITTDFSLPCPLLLARDQQFSSKCLLVSTPSESSHIHNFTETPPCWLGEISPLLSWLKIQQLRCTFSLQNSTYLHFLPISTTH